MAEYLTFEQATTAPKATPEAPVGGEYLTFEQATGAPMPPSPTGFWDKVKGAYGALTEPRLTPENSSVFERGQVLEAPTFDQMYGKRARDLRAQLDQMPQVTPTPRPSILKSTGLAVAGTLPAAADMLTGGVKGAIGLWPYTLAYANEISKGTPPVQAAQKAKELKDTILPAKIFTPWASLAENLGGDAAQAYQENPVGWVMGAIDKVAKHGVEQVAADTGMPAEHLSQMLETFMGIVGTRAFKPGVVKAVNARLESLAGVPKGEGMGSFGPVRGPKADMPVLTERSAAAEVQDVVDTAIKTRTPLETVWNKTKPKGVETPMDTAWRQTVAGLVEEAPKAEGLPPQEGPGITPKTKLAEPTVIGEPVNLLDQALEKLRNGELITKEEAKAVRTLTPRPGEGTIVDSQGRPLFQKGAVDETLLKVLGVMGLGAMAAKGVYDWYSSGGLSGDNSSDLGLGLAAAGAAGVMKPKGGMWHPNAVPRLAGPLAERLTLHPELGVPDIFVRERGAPVHPGETWATNVVTKWLNKEAGTATDRAKNIVLPDGQTLESVTDQAFGSRAAGDYMSAKAIKSGAALGERGVPSRDVRFGTQSAIPGLNKLAAEGKVLPEEPIYDVGSENFIKQYGHQGTNVAGNVRALTSYLGHVGDYIRSLNLSPEKLQQYDLPRAMQETSANDARVAAAALKDFAKPNPVRIADTLELPEYKTYPPVEQGKRMFSFNRDGSIRKMEGIELPAGEMQYSWREIKVPETLTPEQAKRILDQATPENISEIGDNRYVALDAKGEVIKDNFSDTPAVGGTPEEAHLAGQLALEGNALGHCVGGYAESVLSGESRIISLRDQHGRSYATVELAKTQAPVSWESVKPGYTPPEMIAQIKGPGNGAAAEYVKPYIQDFINSREWAGVADAQMQGFHEWKGRYWTPKEIDALSAAEQDAFASRNVERGGAKPEQLAMIAAGAGLAAYAMSEGEKDPLTLAAMGMAGTMALSKTRFAEMEQPELIKAFQESTGRSKELAAAQIYEKTHLSLTRAVQGWGKDLPVEDIVQQTYEKAFAALSKGQFRGEAKLSTWLYGIAKNEMRDIYGSKAEKAARREVAPSVDEETGAQVLPEKAMMEQNPEAYRSAQDVAAGNQMAVQMQRALDRLPDNYRKIFNAVELEGLPYDEAATQLGIPIGTVRSGLARAKEQLQGSLREYRDLQSGKADPALLAKLGLVAGGAVIGANMDSESPISGALAGAAGGFGLAALFHLSPTKVAAAIVDAIKPDTRIRIDQFADAHDAGMVTAKRAIWQQQRAVVQEVPKAEDLNATTHAIQQNKIGSLPPALQSAANRAKTFFAEMGDQAQKAGLIKDLIDDYVTNLWDLTGKNKDVWDAILNKAGGPSMSPETRFALKRSIANLEVGKRLGLTPLTENVAQIMGIYGESLARSMENAKMIKSLKDSVDPASGLKLLLSSEKAPHAYKVIDSPQLTGLRVHPDIAPSLRFIFDRGNSGVIAQGFQALNTAIKRSAVMGSLFHAKALLDGFTGAIDLNKKLVAGGAAAGAIYGVSTGESPIADALIGAGGAMMLPGVKLVGQAALPRAFGEGIYLKQLREGKAGDLVGTLLNSGLKISFEKGPLAVEDVGGSFYTGMTALQQGLDKVIPGAGLPVKGLTMLNHAVDTFMWERLHASMKLTVAAQKLEQLIEANAKANAKDPRVKLMTKEQLAEQASSFTNDIFGGLDWRRIAEATQSKFGRDVALQVYSPAGRRAAQLMLFAPDWTVSTTRAATQAFSPSIADLNPKKLLQTFLEPQNAVGLHRQYRLRSALYYATIANGINYAMSGHYIWDNKDWTTIDMGDGRTMQWSKHMMEPVHWATKPLQQGANKLGYFPKEVINQLTGKEYIATGGNAPPMDTSALGRVAHIGKSALPISAQGAFGDKASSGSALSSILGVPIYGKTMEERAAIKQAMKDLHKTPEYKRLAAERKAAKKEAAR